MDISSSTDAAKALEPVAGKFAFVIFSAGIIGTGLLAVPVLAGSAAFGVGEALQWKVGLARKPKEAVAFYGTLAAATVLGTGIMFTPIDPINALYWSDIINGICSGHGRDDADGGARRHHGRVPCPRLAALVRLDLDGGHGPFAWQA